MATATITTRCDKCRERIGWVDRSWVHLDSPDHGRRQKRHDAVPELRIAIDATCPNCSHPEMGYQPDRAEFICSRCEHTTTERPKG
jgi:hypothetical protein